MGNSTSFNNTPQAGDDLYTSATTGLTEDSLFISYLAVMANDLGGAAKTLYSLDNGTNSSGALSPTDLLTQDIVRTEALTTDRSAQGAKIWITADGKVGYDAATLSAAFQDQLQHLSAGQFLTDTFTYAIRLGNGTLSWATATVQIAGVNDAPVVTGAVTGTALEDGSSVTLNALAHASDVDAGATLSVTNLPGSLPPGVTYDALTHSFTLDPSNPAFQHLAAGAHTTVTVDYGVTDGTSTTPASVSWSIAGTNDAPVVSGAVIGTALEDGSTATLNALAHASDADDGATLTVTGLPASLPQGVTYDALTHSFTLDPSDPAFQHLAAGDHTTVTVNYDVTDGTATTAASVSWTVNGTNDAPVITSSGGGATATLSIDENSTAVTAVTASDADDGATQTYSIVGGADAARFTIDASTGALSFIAAPNSEAPTDGDSDSVYDVTVRVSDGLSFDDQAIAVTVNDVNEFAVTTPSDTNAAADAIDENSAVGTVVGVTAHASDADATTNVVTYSLSDDAGGRFAIDATTGVVTVAGAIDREAAGAALNITVRATSADGSTADQAFTIGINDVDEFDVTTPADTNPATDAIDENSAVGAVVGVTAHASDADATTNVVTYSLADDAGGRFAIDATTGVVTVAGAIDREATGAAMNITVRATSADGSTADQAFTIGINDVDEFDVTTPADTNPATDAIDENSAVGTVVGVTAHASDADATTNVVTYSLSDDAGGRFAIDATTGVVTVAGAIDREAAGATLNITVRATSADGSTADQAFAIGVNDVDEFDVTTPADTNPATDAIDENSAVGTVVGVTAHASDADATTNVVTYSLSDDAGGRFAIDATTGVVTVAGAIDREATGAALNITVRATSADGSTADQAFTIGINDVDEFDVTTPADTNPAANAVNENVAVGTLVGITAAAADADATNNGVTYSLSSNPGGLFAIDATTGVVTTAAAIDREALGSSAGITVRATSADGSTADQAFSIAINGVNESSPVITSNGGAATASVNVAENSTAVTTVTATDADQPAAPLVYSIVGGADAARFAINASSGALSFVSAPDSELPTDSGANNVYDVTVQVSDGTLTDTQAIAVTVTPQNEFAPVITSNGGGATTSVSVAENSTAVTTVTATDADLPLPTFTYSIAGGADAALFTINASTGALAFAAAPDFEAPTDAGANNVYDVTVQVSDGTLTDTQAIAVSVTNVAESGGNDTYTFGLAAGNNTIVDAGGTDAVAITGTPVTSLNFERVGNDLVIDANSTHITVSGHYAGTGNAVESISFTGGGSVYGYALGTGTYTLTTTATGGTSDDVVAGTSAADGLNGGGGGGDDLLFGNASNDVMVGNNGLDLLVGGAGNDTLSGGQQDDTFVFNTALNGTTNVDHITDFSANAADSIFLSSALFSGIGSGGTLAAADFATIDSTSTPVSSQTVGSGVNIVYDSHTGALYFDANGGSLNNAVQFAVLDLPGLTGTVDASDFKVGP
ncbi:beta strand repeat-containing protein [Ideonella sp. YS5]|uniref:beta strand repeat-containing protein n=1 Tax=Ideonella sp. YS5 TaxID=3453714 RepID=UPI003EE87E28